MVRSSSRVSRVTKELLDNLIKNKKFLSLKTGLIYDRLEDIQQEQVKSYNKTLLNDVHSLYMKGECYLGEFFYIFGDTTTRPLYRAFKRANLETLDLKQIKMVYKDQIKIKFQETSLSNWGVDHPRKSVAVQEKAKVTNLERYGVENPWFIEAVQQKRFDTMLQKYGVLFPLQNPNIVTKVQNTNNIKYGSSSYYGSDKHNQDVTKYLETNNHRRNRVLEMSQNDDPNLRNFLFDHYSFTNAHKWCRILGFRSAGTRCEEMIRDFLIDLKIDFKANDRKQLQKLELDFWLPDYKIAIEVNGLYWHNLDFKESQYHFNKFKECYNKGILLLSFTDVDVLDHFEVVKHIIKSNLKMEQPNFDTFNQLPIPYSQDNLISNNYGFHCYNPNLPPTFETFCYKNLKYVDTGYCPKP